MQRRRKAVAEGAALPPAGAMLRRSAGMLKLDAAGGWLASSKTRQNFRRNAQKCLRPARAQRRRARRVGPALQRQPLRCPRRKPPYLRQLKFNPWTLGALALERQTLERLAANDAAAWLLAAPIWRRSVQWLARVGDVCNACKKMRQSSPPHAKPRLGKSRARAGMFARPASWIAKPSAAGWRRAADGSFSA